MCGVDGVGNNASLPVSSQREIRTHLMVKQIHHNAAFYDTFKRHKWAVLDGLAFSKRFNRQIVV